jgi:hypothetical protein
MADGHRTLVERSTSDNLLLRVDDALFLRGDRATWLVDLQIQVGSVRRRLQIPIGRHRALDQLCLQLEREDDSEITTAQPRP